MVADLTPVMQAAVHAGPWFALTCLIVRCLPGLALSFTQGHRRRPVPPAEPKAPGGTADPVQAPLDADRAFGQRRQDTPGTCWPTRPPLQRGGLTEGRWVTEGPTSKAPADLRVSLTSCRLTDCPSHTPLPT